MAGLSSNTTDDFHSSTFKKGNHGHFLNTNNLPLEVSQAVNTN